MDLFFDVIAQVADQGKEEELPRPESQWSLPLERHALKAICPGSSYAGLQHNDAAMRCMEGGKINVQSVFRKIKDVEFEQEKGARLQMPTPPIQTVALSMQAAPTTGTVLRSQKEPCLFVTVHLL